VGEGSSAAAAAAAVTMLEGLVATILSRYLGDYIEGLERENLSLGISSGHVKLENLRLKKEALADLELPLIIKEGMLGSLSLEIPWSEIYSKPSVARIDKLFVVCGPSKPSEYDPALVARKTLETKKRQLQLAELLTSEEGTSRCTTTATATATTTLDWMPRTTNRSTPHTTQQNLYCNRSLHMDPDFIWLTRYSCMCVYARVCVSYHVP